MAVSLEWWALTFEWAGLLPILALAITIDAFVPVSLFIADRCGMKNHPELALLALVLILLFFFIHFWSAFGIKPMGAPLLEGDLHNYTLQIGTDEISESIEEPDENVEETRLELQLEEGQRDTGIVFTTIGTALVRLHVLFYCFISIPAIAVLAIRKRRPLTIWFPLALLGTLGAVVWLTRRGPKLNQVASGLERLQSGRNWAASHAFGKISATSRFLIILLSLATIVKCSIATVQTMQMYDSYGQSGEPLAAIHIGGIELVAATAMMNITLLMWAKPVHTVARVGFHILNVLAMDILFVFGFTSLMVEQVKLAFTLLIPGMTIAAGYRALFEPKQLHGEGRQPVPSAMIVSPEISQSARPHIDLLALARLERPAHLRINGSGPSPRTWAAAAALTLKCFEGAVRPSGSDTETGFAKNRIHYEDVGSFGRLTACSMAYRSLSVLMGLRT